MTLLWDCELYKAFVKSLFNAAMLLIHSHLAVHLNLKTAVKT